MQHRWMVPVIGALLSTWNPLGQARASDSESSHVEINGQQWPVWPAEDLRRRGFEIQDIPRAQNAAWLYIDAINAHEQCPLELNDALDHAISHAWPENVEALEAFLARSGNQKAIQLVLRASAMAKCQFPYCGDPQGSVISLLLPFLPGQRTLSGLVVAEARRHLAEDNADRGIELLLAGHRMGAHLSQGITLIEGLAAIAITTRADRTLTDIVLRHDLSAEQLDALKRELESLADTIPSVERGMKNERHFAFNSVEEIVSRPFRLPYALANIENGWDATNAVPADGWGRLEQRIGRLLLPDRTIKKHMTAHYDVLLGRTRGGSTAPLDEDAMLERIPRWDIVSRILLPSLSRAADLADRTHAEFALLRGAVELRRYMLKHDGAPPDTLDAILMQLPDNALRDCFSGKPVRYIRTPDGWILYSVGLNRVNDGGVAGSRWDSLDIVVTFPPPPVKPFEKSEK